MKRSVRGPDPLLFEANAEKYDGAEEEDVRHTRGEADAGLRHRAFLDVGVEDLGDGVPVRDEENREGENENHDEVDRAPRLVAVAEKPAVHVVPEATEGFLAANLELVKRALPVGVVALGFVGIGDDLVSGGEAVEPVAPEISRIDANVFEGDPGRFCEIGEAEVEALFELRVAVLGSRQ